MQIALFNTLLDIDAKLFHYRVVMTIRIGTGHEHDFVIIPQVELEQAVDDELRAARIALLNKYALIYKQSVTRAKLLAQEG